MHLELSRRESDGERAIRNHLVITCTSIGVDRNMPVFQTGVEGAIPSCSTIFSHSLIRRAGAKKDRQDCSAVAAVNSGRPRSIAFNDCPTFPWNEPDIDDACFWNGYRRIS